MIVVISGKMGAGKSRLAKEIRDYFLSLQVQSVKLRFAQPIHECQNAVKAILAKYGVPVKPEKDGDLMQDIGKRMRQKYGEDVWVNCLLPQMREIPKRAIGIIEDCRYENEFNIFNLVPYKLTIRLECDRDIRKSRCEAWRDDEHHESEVGLDEYSRLKKFDLLFNTDIMSVNECLMKVVDRIKEIRFNEANDL